MGSWRTAVLVVTAVFVAAMAVPAGAAAAPGDLHLASITAEGVKGTWSVLPSISGDGSRVAFTSASRLHPDDDDDEPDIYVKELRTGAVMLVSRAANGDKARGRSQSPAISADGRRVAFVSGATNLHPSGLTGLFVKDLTSGEVFRVGPAADYPVLSADGSVVAFQTIATGLDPRDTDDTADIYVGQVATGTLTLASTSTHGAKANGDFFHGSVGASLSADGRFVAFASGATNLHLDDPDDRFDIYVKDVATGALTLVSTAADGTKSTADSFRPSLSADGQVVAFQSYASNLVPGFSGGFGQIFVKNVATGAVVPASVSASGARADRGAADPRLSADGAVVAFSSSATNLHAADTDVVTDVFVKRLSTGAIELASVSGSGIKGNAVSYQVTLAANGSAVGFRSDASNLHPDDLDSVPDVYVKELGGADPTPVGTADLSISQTDSPDPVPAGQPVTYRIEVANGGPGTATSVVVTDELPAGASFRSATASQGDGCTEAAALVRCHLGVLTPGARATVEVVVAPDGLGTLTNTVSVQAAEPDPDALDNRSSIHTRVTSAADLAVSIANAPDPVPVRAPFTSTVTIANEGPTWGSLALVVTASSEVRVSAATVEGGVTGDCGIDRGVARCSVFGIPDGEHATVRITASARKPGTFIVEAAATPHDFDPNASDNTATATITVTR